MQWDCIRRDSALYDFLKSFVEDVEAGDSQNAIDITADDHLEHDRRAFSDHDLVTELLRLDLEIADGACAAILAMQAKLIVVRAARFDMFQTMRQEKNPFVKG